MKAPRIQAVDMARKIRDRQTRRLAGKTAVEVIAFYRASGQAAVEDARQRAKPRRLRPTARRPQRASAGRGRRAS
jgi:hypothetical protein